MMATMRMPISRRKEDADEVDDIGIRTELAEMKDALLSDDCADQKSARVMIGIAFQPT